MATSEKNLSNRRYRRAMTLIEALVATVLLGVGVTGLISAASLGLRNQLRSEQRTAALYFAQEKMTDVEMVGPYLYLLERPQKGEELRGDLLFEWTIEIEEQAAGELYSVNVQIEWFGAGRGGSVTVETWLNDYEAVMLSQMNLHGQAEERD